MPISEYSAIFDALVKLMQPLVEIVIHDLEAGTICYINGNLSKRAVGSLSLLSPSEFEHDLGTIIYPKINFDGRLIKSVSIPINKKFLACINCDVSIFNHMLNLSEKILAGQKNQPKSLFKNDWQERLHEALHKFLAQNNWHFDKLKPAQKKQAVQYLYELGAFNEKNAADYVAQALGIGRASVFNYLKQTKSKA